MVPGKLIVGRNLSDCRALMDVVLVVMVVVVVVASTRLWARVGDVLRVEVVVRWCGSG